jgi:DegV family protein with EDD domain
MSKKGLNQYKTKIIGDVMQEIAIITDTDSSIPFDLAARYKIYQVVVMVNFGNESYEAVYAINDSDTFRRIDKEGKLPTTAAPAPGRFVSAFKNAFDAGYEQIICLCVSSSVSATYTAAVTAKESFPGREIAVVDSASLSMGLGYMALAAAEAASQGTEFDEILSIITDVRERSHLFAALSTLKYLVMGGWVSNIAGGVATMLNIKPILTIRDGKLEILEKVRSQEKAWERVIELTAITVGENRIEKMCILHVNGLQIAREFENEIRSKIQCPSDILFAEVTPGLSVHSGAGMVGTAFVIK